MMMALLMLMSACETKLDLGAVNTRVRLVVNALINNQDAITVKVTKTIPLGSSASVASVEGATVTLKDDAGNSYTLAYDLGQEAYVSTVVPVPGKYYQINVKANGYPEAWSELVMPEKAATSKPVWKDSTDVDDDGFPTGTLTVRINDKAGTDNYYRIGLFYYDDITAEWRTLEPKPRDASIESNAIKADDGSWVFTDQGFDGEVKNIEFITPFGFSTITPKFMVVNESLSEAYYEYFNSLRNYMNPGGVFTEPTFIYSNIKNGVGIWAGSSMSRDTIR